jgi:hypothetical protein
MGRVCSGGASVQSFGKTYSKIFSARFLFARVLVPIAMLAAGGCFSRRVLADSDVALRETAQRLAERIAAIPGLHGPLRLEWHPDAKWSEGESGHWQKILRDEFERRSLNLTEDPGGPALDVFAVDTPTQVVLTAKTRVSERDEVRIVAVARAMLPPGSLPVAPVRLERQMIYESPDRILDASSPWNGAEGGLELLLYRNFEILALRVDSKGAVKQTVSLNPANLKPSRDPRAEMTPRGGVVSVELQGEVCEFSWESPAEVKCHAEKPAATGKSVWRAAPLLTSPCDGSSWKLRNSGSEPNAREVLQVIPDGTLRESSAAVLSEFPGPIVGTNGEQNPSSALVVVKNLRTGNYEIYKITLACGN